MGRPGNFDQHQTRRRGYNLDLFCQRFCAVLLRILKAYIISFVKWFEGRKIENDVDELKQEISKLK